METFFLSSLFDDSSLFQKYWDRFFFSKLISQTTKQSSASSQWVHLKWFQAQRRYFSICGCLFLWWELFTDDGFQKSSWTCPVISTADLWRKSRSFSHSRSVLTISCIIDYESLSKCTVVRLFLCPLSLSQGGKPLPVFDSQGNHPFRCSFTQSHATDLLPIVLCCGPIDMLFWPCTMFPPFSLKPYSALQFPTADLFMLMVRQQPTVWLIHSI